MKKSIFLFLFLSIYYIGHSQKHDFNWFVGYSTVDSLTSFSTNYGTTYFDFNYNPVKIYKKWINMFYQEANTTLSDENGNMLLTTNIVQARGKDGKHVKNGDTLLYNKGWYKYGIRAPQGVLSLPIPNNEKQYLLVYGQNLYIDFFPIYTSIFDKTIGNNGGIIEKNKIIINDTVSVGKITATKHANGRDWWIHIGKDDNTHYMLLLNPKGVKIDHKQNIGAKQRDGIGQAVFSPDGKKYAECNSINNTFGNDIDIYDFDRCSGLLSKPIRIHYDTAAFSGIAISPNSRFLYFTEGWHVIQYDLQAADIKASETIVVTWDGFQDFGPTGFQYMQLAPDNKIYICTSAATSYMHVIDNPDEKGLACNVRQRGIKLPTYNSRSIPNHPNYRLGALKGSPCDTLKSVSTQDIDNQKLVLIYPNPTSDILNISIANNNPATLIIRDISGRVMETATFTAQTTISTANYFNGMIFCEIWQDNQRISTERIVIQH